jgi:hypothetical protein
MNSRRGKVDRPAADPFGERRRPRHRAVHRVLGGRFEFLADEPALLGLAEEAFGGLRARGDGRRERRFRVVLQASGADASGPGEVPPMRYFAGAGTIGGVIDAANLALVHCRRAEALVRVGPSLLASRYHARCELLEFAVYTLAARVLRQAPLHAACLGVGGRGLLLTGDSGAGKSTITLVGAAAGLAVLSEDSTLVDPRRLQATGLSSYVHVRADTLRFVTDAALRGRIEASPVITRRSGVKKYEVDLRSGGLPTAVAPLSIRALVFLSARAGGRKPLRALDADAAIARLAREQPYAVAHDTWPALTARMRRLPAFELRRGGDPQATVTVLRGLLEADDRVA